MLEASRATAAAKQVAAFGQKWVAIRQPSPLERPCLRFWLTAYWFCAHNNLYEFFQECNLRKRGELPLRVDRAFDQGGIELALRYVYM